MPEGRVFNNQGEFKARYPRRHELLALGGFLGLCLLAGLSSLSLSAGSLHLWYASLNAPALRPPGWVFVPVWVVLYVMTGLAAWEIWRSPDIRQRDHAALRAWGWQMGLKALWTPVFFGLHWLFPAILLGTAALAAAIVTLARFFSLDKAAAFLFLPYVCWIIFELYLNAGFWWLNA